jgi:hypothetical protein
MFLIIRDIDNIYPLKDVRVYAYCFRTGMAFVSLACTTAMDIVVSL